MSSRLICGVDDAGRGCIFGPLFIAGAAMTEQIAIELQAEGVKDSKLLTPQQRERLFDIIKEKATRYTVLPINPAEVDEYVRRRQKHAKLNYLEAIYMARAVNQLPGEVAYIDASDTDVKFFASQVQENIRRDVSIVAVHHADRLFPVVSAASILAKVSRDREIERIKHELGDFGSGYPSDPKTIAFLKEWMKSKGEPPPYTRLSWKTWKKLVQTTLMDRKDTSG
ncbi:MAG: ribonuclease HII [Conexivisphaerales archaeon]